MKRIIYLTGSAAVIYLAAVIIASGVGAEGIYPLVDSGLDDGAPAVDLVAWGSGSEWLGAYGRLSTVIDNRRVVLTLGIPMAMIDGTVIDIPGAPYRSGGRILLPTGSADAILDAIENGPSMPSGARAPIGISIAGPRGDAGAEPSGGGRDDDDSGEETGSTERPADEESESASGGRETFIETIVIDPGHGGHDPGAIGPNGLEEKTVVLDIARRLKSHLEESLSSRIVLTRSDDRFIRLQDRVAIARENDADIFVSIHINSAGGRGRNEATGTEVYFFSNPSDEDAARAEGIEGGPFDPGTENIDPVLWDLMLRGNVIESSALARTIQARLPSALGIPSRGVKSARFYVLHYGVVSDIPSILIETAFISNPEEEARLGDPDFRETAAEAISGGLLAYIDDLEERYPGGDGWRR